jgi:hypothetical protein
MQLFSFQSARGLLERSGFAEIQVKRLMNRFPLGYWSKLFPLPARLKRGTLAALKVSRLGQIPIALPAGNMAFFGYKPLSP